MKKLVSYAMVVVMASLVFASSATAFEGSADSYIGVYSKYLWRGLDVNPDDDFVVQAGSDVSFGNFTVSWWANANDEMDVDEVDIVLDYSFDVNDMVSMSVGNILYEISGFNTNELYASVGFNTILEPSLTVYYDYDAAAGDLFYTAAIGHSFDINEKVSASVGALASYADFDKGFGYSEFHNAEVSAGVDFAVCEGASISISGLFTTPLSDEAEDFFGADDEATVGASITVSF
ncbi:MAG: hypothetical protein OET90_06815 [Desulfuromonadales bacterium]|nr:hypothetical protein [Desulfuromonadales bacterium]